jgi:hypothetical protein
MLRIPAHEALYDMFVRVTTFKIRNGKLFDYEDLAPSLR